MQIASFYVIFLIKCFTQDDGCLLHNLTLIFTHSLTQEKYVVLPLMDPFKTKYLEMSQIVSANLYNDPLL